MKHHFSSRRRQRGNTSSWVFAGFARPHYALTLRHWVRRLEANREVGEPTYRVWRLYMAACALEFVSGGTGIYQILASKRNLGEWQVPLSRRDLYGSCDGRISGVN